MKITEKFLTWKGRRISLVGIFWEFCVLCFCIIFSMFLFWSKEMRLFQIIGAALTAIILFRLLFNIDKDEFFIKEKIIVEITHGGETWLIYEYGE